MGVKAILCSRGRYYQIKVVLPGKSIPSTTKGFARADLCADKGFLPWHLTLREAGVRT